MWLLLTLLVVAIARDKPMLALLIVLILGASAVSNYFHRRKLRRNA
jgi:general stress protein CsbA